MYRDRRINLWHAVAIVGIMLLASLGGAQSNESGMTDQNLSISYGVKSHAYDEKVTGTNVNLVFFADAVRSDGSPWLWADLTEYKVTVGSVTIDLMPIGFGSTRTLRISSTYFGHNGQIDMAISLKATLHGTGVADKSVNLSHTARVRAWNKAAAMGTTLGPAPNQPAVDEAFEIVSGDFITAGNNKLSDMNHLTMNLGDGFIHRDPGVENVVKNATVFVALTHGTSYGFCDSYSRSEDSGFVNFTADVGPWRMTRPAKPKPDFNLVGLWSCDTLSLNNYASTSFGIAHPNINDQAYVGFTMPVALFTNGAIPIDPNTADTIDDHLRRFLVKLEAGKTVYEALIDDGGAANKAFKCFTVGGMRIDMELRGDPRTKLYTVYLTDEEESAGVNRFLWYYLLP